MKAWLIFLHVDILRSFDLRGDLSVDVCEYDQETVVLVQILPRAGMSVFRALNVVSAIKTSSFRGYREWRWPDQLEYEAQVDSKVVPNCFALFNFRHSMMLVRQVSYTPASLR